MKKISIVSLAIFIVSGIINAFPITQLLHVDIGIVSLAIPLVYVGVSIFKKNILNKSFYFIFPLISLILYSRHISIFYNQNKLVNILMLILISFIIAPFLLNDEKDLMLFFNSLVVLGLIIALYSLFAGDLNSNSRLEINGSNPIWVSRAISFAFLWMFLLFLHKKIGIKLFLICEIPILYSMFLTGAKGPILALFGTIFLIQIRNIKLLLRNKKFLVTIYLICLMAIPLFFIIQSKDNVILSRYTDFIKGNDTEYIRINIQRISIALIKTNPLGIGIGNFSYANLTYPHNIILESFLELGWIFGSYFTFLLLVCFIVLYKKSKNNLVLQGLFGFYSIALINAMFSGNMVSPKEIYMAMPIALVMLVQSMFKKREYHRVKSQYNNQSVNT